MRDLLQGDAVERLRGLGDGMVDCVVTSPPYWALRDYGVDGQIGLEKSWREHMEALKPVFAEVKRVMAPHANLWLNYGDTVATGAGGSKRAGGDVRPDPKKDKGAWQPANAPNRMASDDPRKHKLGLAWRLRFMLNDDLGFISRSDVVWHKVQQMPLSMKDRVTPKYEMVFQLVKQPRYFFDLDAIRTPLRDGESWEERRARANGRPKGSPPRPTGEKPDSVERAAWTRDGISGLHTDPPRAWTSGEHVPDNNPNRFNIRVRDAAKGRITEKWGDLAVATPQEAANYQEGGVVVRREKTLDAPELAPARRGGGLRPAPEPGEPGAFHPLGANPGDVWSIPSQPFTASALSFVGHDYVGRDGKPYKVSPDCPVHAGLSTQQSPRMECRDEPPVTPLSHNLGSGRHHVESPQDGSDPIALTTSGKSSLSNEVGHIQNDISPHKKPTQSKIPEHVQGGIGESVQHSLSKIGQPKPAGDNSGFPPRESESTATQHSNGNHKMAPAPLTSQPCTPSGGNPLSTAGNAGEPSPPATFGHTPVSSIEVGYGVDVRGTDPSVGLVPHSAGSSQARRCTCRINSVSHFATFPEALVERCVKAVCPERVCVECGKPWVRVTTKGASGTVRTDRTKMEPDGPRMIHGAVWQEGVYYERGQLTATCGHQSWRPGVVLDPFAGSGTTGLVAANLGRDFILIELNEKYVEIARRRLGARLNPLEAFQEATT